MPESHWLSADVECAVRAAIHRTARAYGFPISAEDVDDLAQESVIRLIERAAAPRSPKAYAAQVARNLTIDTFRKRYAARRDEQRTTTLDEAEQVEEKGGPLVRLLSREAVALLLAKWREALTPKRFRAMYLRYIAGLSGNETAHVMGVSRNAVDGLMHKARQRLRQEQPESRER